MKQIIKLKNISKIMAVTVLIFTVLAGCSPVVRSKQEIPEPEYTQAGYAIESKVDQDGKIIFTYALIGVKEDKIAYLRADQIETNPKTDRHTFTNDELETAYGLLYKGNKGEWNEQVRAICNYISGKEMTIDEVNEIPTEDRDGILVPKKGSELASACELDMTPFLSVINKAYNSREDVSVAKLAMGEDIRVSNKDGRLDVTFAFIGTDYRYKVGYAHIDSYSYTVGQSTPVLSAKERATEDEGTKLYAENEQAFEKFIMGLNLTEVKNFETYDPGDGINTALPKKNTDLAQVCNIDIGYFKKAIARIR